MFNDKYYVSGDQNVLVPAHLNFGKYILDRLKIKNEEIALIPKYSFDMENPTTSWEAHFIYTTQHMILSHLGLPNSIYVPELENIDTKEKLTYKDVTQYAINLATSLTKLGLGKGDLVAIGTEKRNEFIPIILAILFTGATYTPHDLYSGRDDAFDKVISVKDLVKENVDVESFDPVVVSGQSDIALILYSSGTTGMSKGVECTHLNCILNSLPNDFSDSLKVAFITGEWFHNYDTFMTYKFLASGRKIVYAEDINSKSIMRSVDEYQANILFLVPSLISLILKEDDLSKYNLDSLKIIYSGSSPLHKMTIDEVKLRLPKLENLIQGYGMTETGELTSGIRGSKGPKSGSVGKASAVVTLKVSDVRTRKTVGPYEHGEISLKAPILLKGYVGMDLSSYIDEEGFFRTGDLGYYDEDRYFYIVGRIKELIIYDGYNVPPVELETFLQLHPGVREAAVVGKPVPDYGEEPTAFVVKQPGFTVTEQELVDYIAGEVAPYMELRGGVKFIEEIPRNTRGKILRQNLIGLLNSSK